MKNFFALCFLMVIPASFQQPECTESGVFAVEGGNKFLICQEIENGKMTAHFGQCDEQSVFSLETKQCIPAKSTMRLRTRAGGMTCYNKGYMCADCNTLNYCWDRGNGYEVVATKQCGINQQCSAYANACVDKVIPQCQENYTFICNYMGLFPDPYKCNTYYFCERAASEPIVMACPENEYYDPLYSECVKYEVNKKPPCPPMQMCTKENTMFALERNPNIYYICIWQDNKEFTTRVFRCPRDQVFNGDACVPKDTLLYA